MDDYNIDDTEGLKALCALFPDVVITREDSLKANNCTWGTNEFADTHFPHRESVTVRELVRFIRDWYVRNVLWYKLYRLANPRFYLWYRGANDRGWTMLHSESYLQEADAEPDKLMLRLSGNDVRVLPAGQEPG